MIPLWFDENVYMANKLEQLKVAGTSITTMDALRGALQAANLTPYEHYLAYGDGEGVNPNAFFNRTEYLEAKLAQLTRTESAVNWDMPKLLEALKSAGLTAAQHFSLHGWAENVNPSNSFDVSAYLQDKTAQMGPGYTQAELKKTLAGLGIDPLAHYLAYGKSESLVPQNVPEGEQVTPDPARPQNPVLQADGKTLVVHLQSPVVAASIEKADFSVMFGKVAMKIGKVEVKTDSDNYDLLITLEDDSRLPGLLEGEKSSVSLSYNPNGGPASVLTTESGPVSAFTQMVDNQSQCFQILERVTTETQNITTPGTPPVVTDITISTLNITLTPPANYVQPTEVAQFVKVDLSATTGVVSGGTYGIVTAPRLMDGKLVQKLDTTAVDEHVRLSIVANASGTEITTGAAADHIALGGGVDKVNYKSLTVSQLDHMDTIDKFACGQDKLGFTDANGASLITSVVFKGPLSLEGTITESAIQGVFYQTQMQPRTAYVLQNGKEFVLVADVDNNGVFSADKDFALQLTGVTGFPADAVNGSLLTSEFI